MPYTIKQKPEDFIVREITIIKPWDEGDFSYFLLRKRDMTTIEAVRHIADFLRIPLKEVGFAGMKDKAAVTEQYISVKREHEKRLDHFKGRNIELSFHGRGDSKINLGDLRGNEFEIVVRDAKEPKKISSFINYFGEQRFSANNSDVGKAIIKGNIERAAKISQEKQIRQYLKKHPNDFAGAFREIPKKILTMYINAYQSLLWNDVVAEYIKKYGQEDKEGMDVEIVGFGTEFRNKRVKEIYEKLMKKENITKRDFIVRRIPELSSEGDTRKMVIKPENPKIEKLEKKKYKVTFFLPKGCYATELIRQMFG